MDRNTPYDEVEQAVAFYKQGYTCAQSILASFGKRYGLSQGVAFRLGEPFGAGMSCTGDMCGAVSGVIMVLGLQYGGVYCKDEIARSSTYQSVHQFIWGFKQAHRSIQCTDLLGYNLSDPRQLQIVRRTGLFVQLCPGLVRDAAQLLAQILEAGGADKVNPPE